MNNNNKWITMINRKQHKTMTIKFQTSTIYHSSNFSRCCVIASERVQRRKKLRRESNTWENIHVEHETTFTIEDFIPNRSTLYTLADFAPSRSNPASSSLDRSLASRASWLALHPMALGSTSETIYFRRLLLLNSGVRRLYNERARLRHSHVP